MSSNAVTAAAPKRGFNAKEFLMNYGIYIVMILLLIFFQIKNANFLKISNLLLILRTSSVLGIACVGMFFVLIEAGIDISVSMNMYLSAVVGSVFLNGMGAPLGVAFLMATLTGLVVGIINGFFVAYIKIVPFIVTLATYSVCKGLALLFTDQKMVFLDSKVMTIANAKFFGVSAFVYIFLAIVIVAHILLTKTQFGRQLFACGNNLTAANKMGINGARTVFMAYVICGALCGFAGELSSCNLGVINANFAQGDEFVVISSSVIGGASLFGGKGRVLPGAIIGIFLVQAIINGLTMMGASAYVYTIFRGVIIFIAVMIDSIKFSGEIR
ncbi:MAG: ABC transporter permease [Lachnospiraceae bacterium]|nr:ABC transporter permease [Lachnospiraceae bacterium]